MNYKVLVLAMFLLCLSACSERQYHLAQLSNSMTSGNQRKHLKAIQADRDFRAGRSPDGSCPHYGQGYGGFTVSCR